MLVRDVMQTAVPTVRPEDPLESAAVLLLTRGLRAVPVVTGDGALVGVVTERDLLSAPSLRAPVQTVQRVPALARGNDRLDPSARRLAEGEADALFVVDGRRLVGMLTAAELLGRQMREALPPPPAPRAGPVVGEVMHARPYVCRLGDHLLDVVAQMSRGRYRHVPVVDGDGRLVGVLSDRDVRTAMGQMLVSERDAALPVRMQLRRVSDVATTEPVSVREDTPLSEAIGLLLDRRIGALPVVDEGRLVVGIVSYVDLLRRLAERELSPGRLEAERGGDARH